MPKKYLYTLSSPRFDKLLWDLSSDTVFEKKWRWCQESCPQLTSGQINSLSLGTTVQHYIWATSYSAMLRDSALTSMHFKWSVRPNTQNSIHFLIRSCIWRVYLGSGTVLGPGITMNATGKITGEGKEGREKGNRKKKWCVVLTGLPRGEKNPVKQKKSLAGQAQFSLGTYRGRPRSLTGTNAGDCLSYPGHSWAEKRMLGQEPPGGFWQLPGSRPGKLVIRGRARTRGRFRPPWLST